MEAVRYYFKLNEDRAREAEGELFESLLRQGALEVRPLFEGEEDPELGSIFVVEYEDREVGKLLERTLGAAPEVEFMEGPIERRLL